MFFKISTILDCKVTNKRAKKQKSSEFFQAEGLIFHHPSPLSPSDISSSITSESGFSGRSIILL